ncbi:MAG: hypothetical protein WCI17_06910 [bacterium]
MAAIRLSRSRPSSTGDGAFGQASQDALGSTIMVIARRNAPGQVVQQRPAHGRELHAFLVDIQPFVAKVLCHTYISYPCHATLRRLRFVPRFVVYASSQYFVGTIRGHPYLDRTKTFASP